MDFWNRFQLEETIKILHQSEIIYRKRINQVRFKNTLIGSFSIQLDQSDFINQIKFLTPNRTNPNTSSSISLYQHYNGEEAKASLILDGHSRDI